MAVYHDRPPWNRWHQDTGWSDPIRPPWYERSDTEASTWTTSLGFRSKSYHSSVRVSTDGRSRVEACRRSATRTIPGWIVEWLTKNAPTRSPYHGQPCSVSLAEWIPTKPPPCRTYAWSPLSSAGESTSPVVSRNTTTW
jgi:hypothetical protein